MPPLIVCRLIMFPRQMRGGMLRHHGYATLHARDDTVSPRMVEMPGENVGSGRLGRGRIHCSTDLLDRVAMDWYRLDGCRMSLRSEYWCSDQCSQQSTIGWLMTSEGLELIS
jgi:hypothetical protein